MSTKLLRLFAKEFRLRKTLAITRFKCRVLAKELQVAIDSRKQAEADALKQ